MKNLIKTVLNFLFTDVKNKKETKDTAVLIRITCIIFAIYYLIIGIMIANLQHYVLGISLIAAIGILVGSFICTYEDHTILALVLLSSTLIICSGMLSFFVGFGYDFQIPAFLSIFLLYFNKSEHMMFKRFFTIGICIYLMVMAEITEFVGGHGIEEGFPSVYIRFVNIIMITCTIGIIAYCFCTKFNQAEEKLRKINDNLERMANLDTLTGLSNRRHMNEYLTSLEYEYNRSGKAFTLAIGDVDFFKKVNDTYGHDTGDYVLTTLADLFMKSMEGKGHVARWGGEEFLFAFENSNIEKAYKEMDAIRRKIENMPMHFKEYDFRLTMSYGMEEYNDRLGVEVTINKADEKLYKAKTSGRNKVVK